MIHTIHATRLTRATSLAVVGALAVAVWASPAWAQAGKSVEERLDRLEKLVKTLTEEVRALRAAQTGDAPPVVVKTVPANDATDVDPNLTEIKVTFSKDMHDGSWSWTNRSQEEFPEVTGKIHYEKDKRTCVLPVKLEPGKTYWIGLNSPRHKNFKDAAGNPATPYPLTFTTKQ